MSTDADDETFLDLVLKKTASGESESAAATPEECSRLTTTFDPTKASSTRAKAFLVLSSICDRQRRSSPGSQAEDDPGTHNILHLFLPIIESKLSDVEEGPLLEALSFTAALLGVDWRTGSSVFVRSGFQDSMMDSLDLFPSSATLPFTIAGILSLACGHKTCVSALSPRCSAWLEMTFHRTKDTTLKSVVSLALLKLTQGAGENEGVMDSVGIMRNNVNERHEELFKVLRDIVEASSNNVRDVADALEGLAYLSTMSSAKEKIVKDPTLLQKLVSFRFSLPTKVSYSEEPLGTAPFGLAAIIANIGSYRPHLTEEQSQIARLRRMAQPGASKSSKTEVTNGDELDDDEFVRRRGKLLVEAGAVDLLVCIARATDSPATRMIVGKGLLALIENKDNRGKVLQAGGAKTLMNLIRASAQTRDSKPSSPQRAANMEFADLLSIQALAKLAITASPLQVFGPDENFSIEAIRPFVCLLLYPSSTLLQKFESLMALTNLSSTSPELATRVTDTEGLLNKVEYLLLEENQLVRRAASELLCNLVSGSERAFNKFSGDDDPESTNGSLNQTKSRLHILIALADVEDEATRLAASGALAVLTGSPTACRLILLLEFEHHRVFPILQQLIDPSPAGEQKNEGLLSLNSGLLLRGIVCLRNIFTNTSGVTMRQALAEEAVKHHLVDALMKIMGSASQADASEAVLRPTAEALKWLLDSGVDVVK